jgi:hypothetical protein
MDLCNAILFNGIECPAFKTSQQVLALLPHYIISSSVKEPRILRPVEINPNVPWGYFDGVCQGPENVCGVGFKLHLSNTNFISGKVNLGRGTNNKVELLVLFHLLKCAWIRIFLSSRCSVIPNFPLIGCLGNLILKTLIFRFWVRG